MENARNILIGNLANLTAAEAPQARIDGIEGIVALIDNPGGFGRPNGEPVMPRPTLDTEPRCHRCNDSGTVAISSRTLRYTYPGPVPDNARGVYEATCTECPKEEETP